MYPQFKGTLDSKFRSQMLPTWKFYLSLNWKPFALHERRQGMADQGYTLNVKRKKEKITETCSSTWTCPDQPTSHATWSDCEINDPGCHGPCPQIYLSTWICLGQPTFHETWNATYDKRKKNTNLSSIVKDHCKK